MKNFSLQDAEETSVLDLPSENWGEAQSVLLEESVNHRPAGAVHVNTAPCLLCPAVLFATVWVNQQRLPRS